MTQSSAARMWSRGGLIFAATMLIIIGIYQVIVGLAAIIQNNFFVVSGQYAYEIDTTVWGWIHLGIGVLAALTGFFLFTGAMWARVVGIGLAVLSAIANFFFVPYYPIWSLLIIALDVFVIWSLATVSAGVPIGGSAAAGAYAGQPPQPAYAGDTQQAGERWPTATRPAGRHWASDATKEPAAEEPGAAEPAPTTAPRGGTAAGRPPTEPPSTPPTTPPGGSTPG